MPSTGSGRARFTWSLPSRGSLTRSSRCLRSRWSPSGSSGACRRRSPRPRRRGRPPSAEARQRAAVFGAEAAVEAGAVARRASRRRRTACGEAELRRRARARGGSRLAGLACDRLWDVLGERFEPSVRGRRGSGARRSASSSRPRGNRRAAAPAARRSRVRSRAPDSGCPPPSGGEMPPPKRGFTSVTWSDPSASRKHWMFAGPTTPGSPRRARRARSAPRP